MSDILDLIDHAIADHGWGLSDDAMRWAPSVTKDTMDDADVWARQIGVELAAFGEALRSTIWPALERVVRHVAAMANQEPLRTLLADRLRHQRRMSMWRRKARATWPRWTQRPG